MPFIYLGILIVLFVVGLVLLSYLLIFGAIVGLCLFAFTWLREKLFNNKENKKSGRTIDHDKLS